MAGLDRCKRCVRKARSWYGTDFETVVSMSKDKKHEAEFKAAETSMVAIEAGQEQSVGTPMSVTAGRRTGYRMESRYSFVTPNQFAKRFKFHPKALGVKVIAVATKSKCACLPSRIVQYFGQIILRAIRDRLFFSVPGKILCEIQVQV